MSQKIRSSVNGSDKRVDYELVRAHHPDSACTAHLPADEAHANFRHIKASYDFLSGKTLSPHPNARAAHAEGSFDPYAYELARRRRAYYASRSRAEQAEAEQPAWAKGWGGLGAHPNERSDYDQNGWRERTIFFFGVVVRTFSYHAPLRSPSNVMPSADAHGGSIP